MIVIVLNGCLDINNFWTFKVRRNVNCSLVYTLKC